MMSGQNTSKRLIITDQPEVEPYIQEYPINDSWEKRINHWDSFNYYNHQKDLNIQDWTELNGFSSEDEDWKKISEWEYDPTELDDFITKPFTDLDIKNTNTIDLLEVLNFIVYGINTLKSRNNWQINRELQNLKLDDCKDLLYLNYDNVDNFIRLIQRDFVYLNQNSTKLRAICLFKIINLLDEDINIFINKLSLFTSKCRGLRVWYIMYFNYGQFKTSDIVILYNHIFIQIDLIGKKSDNHLVKELQFITNYIENVILIKNLRNFQECAMYLKLNYAVTNIDELIEREECDNKEYF